MISAIKHKQKEGAGRVDWWVGHFKKATERGKGKCRDLWIKSHTWSFLHVTWWKSQDHGGSCGIGGGENSSNNNIINSIRDIRRWRTPDCIGGVSVGKAKWGAEDSSAQLSLVFLWQGWETEASSLESPGGWWPYLHENPEAHNSQIQP